MDQKKDISVGCVVMAAGSARRFGANKLAAELDGRSLIRRALEAVPSDHLNGVCVVTRYGEVEAIAREFGFRCIRSELPAGGVSFTIRLGTEALMGQCDAILYQTADQPFLRRETVAALVEYYRARPGHIVSISHDGKRGSPVIFPKEFFPELCDLTGDMGGRAVIRRHEDRLLLFEVDARELADVDTRENLIELSK